MQKLVYAKFKNCNTSARKTRLVADLIRGKKALDAVDILTFCEKAVAVDVLKTLNSAIANAVHNENLNKKELMVAEVLVDEAQTYKRGRAVSKGRYHQILKRNCHITIGLSGDVVKKEKKKAVKKTETKKTTKKTTKKVEDKKKVVNKKVSNK